MFHADGSTNNLKMPIESHSAGEGTAVGAWVLLQAGQREGVKRSGRALTPNVRNAEFSASGETNLSALARVWYLIVLLCAIHMHAGYVFSV